MSATKKPVPVVLDRRSQQAVEAFEKALRTLHKRDYEKAGGAAGRADRGLPRGAGRARARARLPHAVRPRPGEAKKSAFKPKSFDEMLHYGVYLHNRGEFEEALKFLHQAAEIHPRNEHVLYCLAATAARAGDTAAALKALRTAIQASGATGPRRQERLRLRRHPRGGRVHRSRLRPGQLGPGPAATHL